MKILASIIPFILIQFISSCNNNRLDNEAPELSEQFNNYWFDGNAEISTYALNQARYGEFRSGKAVMIFVTEQFSEQLNTKSDKPSDSDVSILKLNFTKNFITGIYPYAIMTSAFVPLEKKKHALKITNSTQEWCGQTYMELTQKSDYNITINSYFEGESKDNLHQEVNYLEDEIWALIRINPNNLPLGKIKMIPSFSYLRLMHKDTKTYDCNVSLVNNIKNSIYTIEYPELSRTLKINFNTDFPYLITSWEDSYPCVGCESNEVLTSSGTLIKSIKIDYWNKNETKDSTERKMLGLF